MVGAYWFGINSRYAIASLIFYKCNMFNCLLRAIIGRSTSAQVESDGSLTFDLPHFLAPKIKREKSSNKNLNRNQTTNEQQDDNLVGTGISV